jgi:glycosyltransferase involved in cell wall biosynthesis
MMNKPKVLILGHLPPPYMGPAIATEIILNSTLRDSFDLLHLDTNVHKNINTLYKWSVRSLFLNFHNYLSMIFLLFKNRPSVILIPISQTTLGFIKDSLYIYIAWLFRKKIILQLRGSNFLNWYQNSSFINRKYVEIVLNRASGVIVLGEKIKCQFNRFFSLDQIYVVPNGGNYNILLEKNNCDQHHITLLYLSNLQASKGIDDVINAVSLIKDKVAGYRIDVIGEWRNEKDRIRINDLVKRDNIPVNFHSTQIGEAKFSILSQADIFLFPPREPEGHPWVIVEAMAAGLPIIATDQGAITESVKDGVNGFIVEKENPAQIAEKIIYLIEHPDVREQMGKASRRLYLENFTEEKMVARMVHAFNTVLGSQHAY